MARLLAVLAIGACFSAPMLAQVAPPPPTNNPMNQGQTLPSQQTAPSNNQMTAPSQGNATTADLTGQAIYTAKGRKIGSVAAMSTGSHGEQAASVTMEKYLGMGGQTVLIPVSTLKPRAAGGFTTSLSAKELKALPKAGTGQAQ